jgi:hypothetical protein
MKYHEYLAAKMVLGVLSLSLIGFVTTRFYMIRLKGPIIINEQLDSRGQITQSEGCRLLSLLVAELDLLVRGT